MGGVMWQRGIWCNGQGWSGEKLCVKFGSRTGGRGRGTADCIRDQRPEIRDRRRANEKEWGGASGAGEQRTRVKTGNEANTHGTLRTTVVDVLVIWPGDCCLVAFSTCQVSVMRWRGVWRMHAIVFRECLGSRDLAGGGGHLHGRAGGPQGDGNLESGDAVVRATASVEDSIIMGRRWWLRVGARQGGMWWARAADYCAVTCKSRARCSRDRGQALGPVPCAALALGPNPAFGRSREQGSGRALT